MSGGVAAPSGGRFDFDDGGTFAGGWTEGRAHGHGVCTGPKGQGEFCGAWEKGFESSGVYTWPTGHAFEGQWQDGKRHGLGCESRGRWVYRGEWTDGLKGRYGVRQSIASAAKYDGTWAAGLQDGYGSETYADGGTFQGQWARGVRHGYGVRSSAPFGLAAHARRRSPRRSPSPGSDATASLDRRRDAGERGGFVLATRSATWGRIPPSPDHPQTKGIKGLLLSRTKSVETEEEEGSSEGSFTLTPDEPVEPNVIETYMGEWKADKRSGYGIAERSDGMRYEGEWHNNRKFGYGRTTYKDGLVEDGKYRNNVLVEGSGRRRHLFLLRSAKFRERVEAAVGGARRSSHIALQKADIAISRTATARGKAEQADEAASIARSDAELARLVAKKYAPEFHRAELRKHHSGSRDSTELLLHSEDRPASAFLDVFRNNPEGRRPSVSLRRPSALFDRRPSTVIELRLAPSFAYQKQDPYSIGHAPQPLWHAPDQQLSVQQVVDDHFRHYYELRSCPRRQKTGTAFDLEELSALYGLPRHALEEEEEPTFVPPQRRSTLPTVMDSAPEGEGFLRTGSLYSATRKREEPRAGPAPARKKSLPDIGTAGGQVLSREAIAALSSQRREAVRREEEEAARLRANPLLYLASPEVRDWLASQQLVILIVLLNAALGFLLFKVIL